MIDLAQDNTAPAPDLIDLGTDATTIVPSDVATTRATKFVFGSNVNYDEAFNAITNGKESQFRSMMAAQQVSHNANAIVGWIQNRSSLSVDDINRKFNQPVLPESFFENNYAKQYVSWLRQIPGIDVEDNNDDFTQAVKTMPEHTENTLDLAERLLTLREVLNKGHEDSKANYDNQSYIGWGFDLAKSLVTQVYPEFKLRGNVPGSEFGLGLGQDLENQRQRLWSMPTDQAVAAYLAAKKNLDETNPGLAVQWTGAMLGQTNDEKLINNFFTTAAPLDILAAGKIGVSAAKAISTDRFIKRMASTIVEAAPNAEKVPVRQAVADAVGANDVAGQIAFQDGLLNLKGTNEVKEAVEGFQSALRVDRDLIIARPGNNGGEVVNRLREAYNQSIDRITNAIINVSRVERIGSVLASQKVVKAAWDEIKDNYRGLSNSILQLSVPKRNPLTGGYNVDMFLGRADGTFFGSYDEAREWAKLNGVNISHFEDIKALRGSKGPRTGAYLREADVPIVGKRFYLVRSVPLRETDNFIRDALLETEKSKTINRGWLNSLGLPAYLRTPEEVLSAQERTNRLVSIYAPSILKQVLSNETVSLAKARRIGRTPLSLEREANLIPTVRNYYKNFGKGSEFERFLEMTQKKVDPETGKPGFEYTHPETFSAAFQQAFQRLPDPIEVEGYFAYQRGLAMDWAFRNLALYRNMTRVGAETHQLYAFVNGVRVNSEPFAGVVKRELPGGDSPIMLMDEGGQKLYNTGTLLNSARGRKAAEALKNGEYKVIEIYNRDHLPLSGFNGMGGADIRYVLTKNVESRPLDFTQLPRQKGGHFVYDYDHYIKQADISINDLIKNHPYYRYKGDTTLMPIDNRALGNDVVKHLENVRKALKDGSVDAAKDAARKLPIPWEKLSSWFKPTFQDGKLIPARLSLTEPFYVVPKNKMIKDLPNHFDTAFRDAKTGKNLLEDGTTSGSLARQFQVEFTGQRDAYDVFAIEDKGNRSNPLYDYQPARTVDPITVLNRSLTRIVDSVWMDDYKISAMEHWIQEALQTDALKATKDEIRSAPWHHFMNTKLKDGLPQEQKALLDAKRWQIKSFIGVPSTVDAYIHGVQQTLADTVYGGSNSAIRTGALLSKWALSATTNAPQFLRSMAYRMDIGLFSIPQFVVQSQNYASIAGIAGFKRAGQGTLGGLLHQYSRWNSNPEILQALDNLAVRMGYYKPGEWLEARKLFERTGFEYVGKETNQLMTDFHMGTNFVRTGVGNMLNAGEIFFKGGERNQRYAAMYTAYKEFREAHPTGRITEQDQNAILLRANMLAGDMTKSSKSAIQMGPLAFTTQFLGYTLRQAEMFTGKRLTRLEKARLFGVNAILYGVPIAASSPLFGLPINDQVRKYAIDNGYVDGEHAIASTLMNGVPAAVIQMIDGKIHGTSGTLYNIGPRLGPGSIDIYRDTLMADKSFWSVVSGPVGQMLSQAGTSFDPFIAWASSYIHDTDPKYKPTQDDLLGVLKNPAAGNNFVRFGHAIRTGDWISRNEQVVSREVSPLQATMMSITGVQPMRADDARVMQDALEIQKKTAEQGANLYIKAFRRGLQAVGNKDYDQADQDFKNAQAILKVYKYPEERRDQLFALALQDQTVPERTEWNYYMGRDVPAGEEDLRAQTYGRIQELLNKGK